MDVPASVFFFYGIITILALGTILSGIFQARTTEAVVIQRMGRFLRVASAGINFKLPWLDQIAARIDVRVQQLALDVETKTKDNVFVKIPVSVQYHVIPEKVYRAFRKFLIEGTKPNLKRIKDYVGVLTHKKRKVVTAVRGNVESDRVEWMGWPVLVHSARTAVAAVASVLVAQLFRLPEPYWAPITTLVITQSSLGAALTVSWQRFVGTVLGAVVGAIVASHFGPHVLVFGTCVFILGLLRGVAHLDLSAYRFGGVTLAIVLLVPRTGPAWQIAFHRFAEVSIGIGVALMLAMVWPEREATAPEERFPRKGWPHG